MSWAADCAFDEFTAQFNPDVGFSSAHEYRDRHGSAALNTMSRTVHELMGALRRTLGR